MVFNIPPTLPPNISTPMKKRAGVEPIQPDSAVEPVQKHRPAYATEGNSEKRRGDRRKENRKVLFDMRSGRDRRHDQGRIDEDV